MLERKVSDMVFACKAVEAALLNSTNFNLNNDGDHILNGTGGINGEMTKRAVKAIFKHLKDVLRIDVAKAIFADGGANTGFPLWMMVQLGFGRAMGWEAIASRVLLGCRSFKLVRELEMQQPWRKAVRKRVALFHANMLHLDTFCPATVILFNDEGFEPELSKSTWRLAAMSETVEVVISVKASKYESLHDTFMSWSGHCFARTEGGVLVPKRGLNAGNSTAYFYTRVKAPEFFSESDGDDGDTGGADDGAGDEQTDEVGEVPVVGLDNEAYQRALGQFWSECTCSTAVCECGAEDKRLEAWTDLEKDVLDCMQVSSRKCRAEEKCLEVF
jgi:hypothetical protein